MMIGSYMLLRVVIGLLDTLTDLIVGVNLLLEGHTYWGGAVLVWVGGALIISSCQVLVGRCLHGDPMSCPKFLLLTLKVHTEVGQAMFQSGPQLLTQLVVVWSGVYSPHYQAMLGPASWSAVRAWIVIFSLLLSLTSLLITSLHYNKETVGPTNKQVWSGLSYFTSLLYRMFVISLMIKLAPLISLLVLLVIYLLTTSLHRLWGDSWAVSLSHSYSNLYLPLGHTQTTGAKTGYISHYSGVPEAERNRINQEGLLRRVEKFFSLHLTISLLLLAPLFTYLEVWYYPSSHFYNSLPLLLSRLFTYLTPLSLLLLNIITFLLYYRQTRKERDAAKTWNGITPGASALLARSPPLESPIIISPPLENPDILTPPSKDQITVPTTPPRPMIRDTGRPVSEISRPTSELYPNIPSAPSEAGDIAQYPPPGSRKCPNDECVTCTWLVEGPNFYSSKTNKKYRFMTPVTCADEKLIYLVTCRKCRKQYVGKTEQSLRQRHYGHRREVDTGSSLLGRHFGEGCGYDNWRLQIIDKCNVGELTRREGHWQHELGTLQPEGLNVRDELGGQGGGG